MELKEATLPEGQDELAGHTIASETFTRTSWGMFLLSKRD